MSDRDDHQPVQKPAPALRRIPIEELLGRADQVILVHRGEEYRLRLTRANKLILTK
jgi:hemin uptake protein HemP